MRAAATRFRLTLDPQPGELVAGFEHWADRVDSWRRPLGYVAQLVRSHHARHLDSEGATTGPRFAPLSPAYKREKDRRWAGRPVLTRTGALLAALADRRSVGHLERITDTSLVVGIDPTATTADPTRSRRRTRILEYALAHQRGDAHLPARPPVRADMSATPGTLGHGVRQILQVEIVGVRREAFGQPIDVDGRMARLAKRETR